MIHHVCIDFGHKELQRPEVCAAELGEEIFRRRMAQTAWEQERKTAERKARWEEAQAILSQLPEKPRQLLLWHYYEGWSCAEIAHRIGSTEESVRAALHYWLKKCRRIIEQERQV